MKQTLLLAFLLLPLLACSPSTPAPAVSYVASRLRGAFHRPGCQWAQRIAPANRQVYPTRAAAIASGRHPCRVCRP